MCLRKIPQQRMTFNVPKQIVGAILPSYMKTDKFISCIATEYGT